MTPATPAIAALLADIAAYQTASGATDHAVSMALFNKGSRLAELRSGADIHTGTLATALERLARLREASK